MQELLADEGLDLLARRRPGGRGVEGGGVDQRGLALSLLVVVVVVVVVSLSLVLSSLLLLSLLLYYPQRGAREM